MIFLADFLPDNPSPLAAGNCTGLLLVTVFVHSHRPVLANKMIHRHLRAAWNYRTDWLVGHYLVMPDHMQFFCAPGNNPAEPIKSWVTCWKSVLSEEWPYPHAGRLWQRDCRVTKIRNRAHQAEEWENVRQKPVRAGLVKKPDRWPYQGELHPLSWRE